jgi:peptidoglycan/xylan/chitin deacetylase (PgdA/CDA1 family)
VQRIKDRFAVKSVVLLYHRVAALSSDPQLLSVHPQRFAKQIEYIATHYQVWSLQQVLKAAYEDRCLPEGVVAVTFDDGYVDNLLEAKPVLEAYQSPATVFVSTAHLDREREFWWDELERILLFSRSMPACLRVTVGGKNMEWLLEECARQAPHRHPDYTAWDVTSPLTPAPCYQVYRDMHRLLRPLGFEEREAILARLRAQVGCDEKARSGYRAMQEVEVRQLAASGLIDVGAHTVTHPVFSTQSIEVRRYELLEGRRRLQDILGTPVTSFAYPFGGPSDIGDTPQELIQEAGYEVACSTIPRPLTVASDRWRLPRFLVRDWDGDEFAERLSGFFRA